MLIKGKSDFLLKLHYSFQTSECLYLAMEYCPGALPFHLHLFIFTTLSSPRSRVLAVLLVLSDMLFMSRAMSSVSLDKHCSPLTFVGGDLREFLEVVGSIEEEEAILWFAEMIMAVHTLHNLGYIHRLASSYR